MARVPLLNLRVDEATKARWQAAADHAGVKLSEFIRQAVNARCDQKASLARAGAPPQAAVEAVGVPLDAEQGKASPLSRTAPLLTHDPPAIPGGKVFRGPHPRPESRKRGR